MNRKRIFDVVRTMLGRGFRRAEIDALDAALDRYGASEAPPSSQPTGVSPTGLALIKNFEGCARIRRDGLVEAYPDPGTGGDP